MNAPDPGSSAWRTTLVLLAIQCLFLATVAINGQSLWIDEFGTWNITQADNLLEWWRRFAVWPNSNVQIPLYHFYMFLWTKVAGTSEYALRFANFPLYVLGELALLWPFRHDPLRMRLLLLVSGFNAFLWYYLDEARPYVMLYFGACLATGAMITLLKRPPARGGDPEERWVHWELAGGVLLLSGASVLGIPWAGAAVALLLVSWFVRRRSARRELAAHWTPLAAIVVGGGAILAHDIASFLHGAKATQYYETNPKTLLFSAYELSGLSGLGPGRLLVRGTGVESFAGYLPALLLAALPLAWVFIVAARRLYRDGDRPVLMLALGAVLLPLGFLGIAATVLHWRIVGRHLMPLLPLLLVLIATGLATLWRQGLVSRAIAVMAILGLIASSLTMGFSDRHRKDDYRGAAAIARAALAQGDRVWWSADSTGARYYGIAGPFPTTPRAHPDSGRGSPPRCPLAPAPHQLAIVSHLERPCLDALPRPQLVVFSKPDTYDRGGALAAYLAAGGFHVARSFPAFTIWR